MVVSRVIPVLYANDRLVYVQHKEHSNPAEKSYVLTARFLPFPWRFVCSDERIFINCQANPTKTPYLYCKSHCQNIDKKATKMHKNLQKRAENGFLGMCAQKSKNQYKITNPRPRTRNINGAQYRPCLPVKSLTDKSLSGLSCLRQS